MAAATAPRKTISIYDYPEHLNPFHEEDNHNKIRFWTLGRRPRSNSISFSGLKDLKNSWALRSFMRKGKKGQQTSTEKSNIHVNGDTSPIIYRRALQYTSGSGTRSTVGSPERTDRYVYGGSVTPLPRSRFQERLRSTSQHEVNSLSASPRMARSEVSGSRISMESTNPFEDNEEPVPPVRASRRKKKRAPPPPPGSSSADMTLDTTTSSITSDLQIDESESCKKDGDIEIEETNMNIELKIIEDEDFKGNNSQTEVPVPPNTESILEPSEITIVASPKQTAVNVDLEKETISTSTKNREENNRNTSSDEDILNSVTFRKVDITKYRRNSSVNEDDIRLRRGNLEDFHLLTNKRSKSLTNALDGTYITYDMNDNATSKDANGNDEPQKLVCKVYDDSQRKQSIDTISSTEKEFLEIDRATRELEREINKLNSALNNEDLPSIETRLSVSEIKKKFDKNNVSSPNPIPKPRRSHYGGVSNSP